MPISYGPGQNLPDKLRTTGLTDEEWDQARQFAEHVGSDPLPIDSPPDGGVQQMLDLLTDPPDEPTTMVEAIPTGDIASHTLETPVPRTTFALPDPADEPRAPGSVPSLNPAPVGIIGVEGVVGAFKSRSKERHAGAVAVITEWHRAYGRTPYLISETDRLTAQTAALRARVNELLETRTTNAVQDATDTAALRPQDDDEGPYFALVPNDQVGMIEHLESALAESEEALAARGKIREALAQELVALQQDGVIDAALARVIVRRLAIALNWATA